MQIPTEIVVLFLGAFLSLQGWTLQKISSLQTQVAVLNQKFNDSQNKI